MIQGDATGILIDQRESGAGDVIPFGDSHPLGDSLCQACLPRTQFPRQSQNFPAGQGFSDYLPDMQGVC